MQESKFKKIRIKKTLIKIENILFVNLFLVEVGITINIW